MCEVAEGRKCGTSRSFAEQNTWTWHCREGPERNAAARATPHRRRKPILKSTEMDRCWGCNDLEKAEKLQVGQAAGSGTPLSHHDDGRDERRQDLEQALIPDLLAAPGRPSPFVS